METNVVKQPLRVLEIPLSKFTDEVIPHYQRQYEKQKVLIHKLLTDENLKDLKKEISVNEKAILQLKDLMYELDILRQQVEEKDAAKFDAKTLGLRKSIITLLTGYSELSKSSKFLVYQTEDPPDDGENPFEGAGQLQISENVNDLKLKAYNEKLSRVEALNEEVNDINAIFGQLNEMVQVQGEAVQDISENVESTANNVNAGLNHLRTAQKYKAATYPMTGAVLGGILGGPIGLVAGAKIGSVAAIMCAIAGYTGGKVFKNANDAMIPEPIATAGTVETQSEIDSSEEKKKT